VFEQIKPVWMDRIETRHKGAVYRCPECEQVRTVSTDRPPKRWPCGRCAARFLVKHGKRELLDAWKEAHPNQDAHSEIVERVNAEANRRMFLFPHAVHRGKELAHLVDVVTACTDENVEGRAQALEKLAGFVLAWRIAEVPRG
jgi:DNA-directed RNA polymerase subunit RPC12/RpoP